MGGFDVSIAAGTPEARRAAELVRELVTARVAGAGVDDLSDPKLQLFVETLNSVLAEVFEGAPVQSPHLERVAYLLMAFSKYGAVAVGLAAAGHEDLLDGEHVQPESIERMLQAIAQAMAQHDADL
jgi:hypothetical protein